MSVTIDQKVKDINPEVVKWKWYPSLATWLDDILDEEEKETLHLLLDKGIQAEYLIMRLIDEADDAECLTSSINYVRDAKLFFIKRKGE
jgi:hypothetical protein